MPLSTAHCGNICGKTGCREYAPRNPTFPGGKPFRPPPGEQRATPAANDAPTTTECFAPAELGRPGYTPRPVSLPKALRAIWAHVTGRQPKPTMRERAQEQRIVEALAAELDGVEQRSAKAERE